MPFLPVPLQPARWLRFVLSTASWLLSVLAVPVGVMAQPVTAASRDATLPAVVVTGTREPTPLDRVVGDIVVIDAEEIRRSAADSLEDLLRRAGGIQLSRNGGPGQNASILLRGSGATSTLVLLDGVRIGSVSLGQVDLASLSLAGIERIEILRGPASSLYGADAVGGVVQIFTRQGAGAPRFGARAEVGELTSGVLETSVSGAAGAVDYALDLAREQSHGVSATKPGDALGAYNPDRDGYRRHTAQLGAGYALAPGHRVGVKLIESRLQAQYDSTETFPPFSAAGDFRNRYANRIGSIDYRGALSKTLTTSVQLSSQVDDLTSGASAPTRFRTERRQLTWQNAWRPAEGQQWVGALESLDEKVTEGPYGFVPSRHNTAAVLGYTGAFGGFRLQADARADRNSVYGEVGTGKLGLAYHLQPNLVLRLVGGTAFRAPAFNELFFPGYGVTTIGPERARSVEAGLQWRGDRSALGLTLYRNRVRDLIAYEADRSFCPAGAAYDFGCAHNISRARLMGATLSASHRWGSFSGHADVDFLDAKDADSGQRLPRRAAHQERLAGDWTHGAWTAGAELLRVGARPEGGAILAGYEVVDLRARYRIGAQWQLEAKLLNAFDRHYEPARDYQALGRQGWVGVRYESAGL